MTEVFWYFCILSFALIVFFVQSEYVWIKPPREGEFEVPLGARVISRDARRVKVLDDEGHETWIALSEMLRSMHSTSISGVEDMTVLGDLQEHAILRNLLLRYYKDLIYVRNNNSLFSSLVSCFGEILLFVYLHFQGQ